MNLSPLRDPIQVAKAVLKQFRSRVKAAIVDFHAESVDEKEALGLSLDGEVVRGRRHPHPRADGGRADPAATGRPTSRTSA